MWLTRRRQGDLAFAAALLAAVLSVALLYPSLAESRSKKRSASEKQLVACVKMPKGKKKNGAMLFRQPSTTGCKKGWKKIWWNEVGPQGVAGPQGPEGPKIYVTDVTGAKVGQFLGYNSPSFPFLPAAAPAVRSQKDRAKVAGGPGFGFLQTVAVLRDGGIYSYLMNGRLWPSSWYGDPVYWSDSACTQNPFFILSTGDPSLADVANDLALAATGQQRVVVREISNGFGPARAFTGIGIAKYDEIGEDVYRIDGAGQCVDIGTSPGLWTLPAKAVEVPPDFKGPLTVG